MPPAFVQFVLLLLSMAAGFGVLQAQSPPTPSTARGSSILFLIGEDEYKTWETLPAFAESDLKQAGFTSRIVHQDPKDKHRYPGLLEAIPKADLIFVSLRRRGLATAEVDAIQAHVRSGKPLIGIRTASHGFAPRADDAALKARAGEWKAWPEFDAEVLGGNYTGHHDAGPKVLISQASDHPILKNLEPADLTGTGSLYKVLPLQPSAVPILTGSIPGQPRQPVAWVYAAGPAKARVFYTSLGAPQDFEQAAFRKLLLNAIAWALDRDANAPAGTGSATGAGSPVASGSTAPGVETEGWGTTIVPGPLPTAPEPSTGVFWLRALVRPSIDWNGKPALLRFQGVTAAFELFWNGERVGSGGRFPPMFEAPPSGVVDVPLPPERVWAGEWNLVTLRMAAAPGQAVTFPSPAPILQTTNRAVAMSGLWQMRWGDDPAWATHTNAAAIGNALFNEESSVAQAAELARKARVTEQPKPLPPRESAALFRVAPDLELDLVLSEPEIAQPLQISFDERGRMWVVEYRQYPAPAGLKLLSHDQFWRAVYDKVPAAPPNHVPGRDRISIHEDTNGDGTYDRHKVFVDGLNIATAAARGRGGVWVLNPPYLLFYPDRNDDDVPDGDPTVHLSGFGLEDTHSVVNSLRWGPDGWLYAAQGSTVSAQVRRGGEDPQAEVTRTMGQNIWRYHPERQRFEVFAEGGGNAFGVEIDDQGRIFSGHNGGNTRGFHYMQGAYLQKGFQKHGELSNPHAYGYFPPMAHPEAERFTHTFLVYGGAALPASYTGKLFGIEPLQGRVVLSEILPDKSTFGTRDLGFVVTSEDRWFKPVDIKQGPDGAIYIADWYDFQVNHWRNYQGNMDASNGRVYRLRARGSVSGTIPNLKKLTNLQLVDLLSHSNRWMRHTAIRLLGDRKVASLRQPIRERLTLESESTALDLLWGLHACGGLDESAVLQALKHPNAQVRAWTARLVGDTRITGPNVTRQLAATAAVEPDIEVRNQLASTAARLSVERAVPILRSLLTHDEDASDPRQPLLIWWALESKVGDRADAVIRLFRDPALWSKPLVKQHLLQRLMRRLAAPGRGSDLENCATLLTHSPAREFSLELMKGFEAAYSGRSITGLPESLLVAMDRHQVLSPALELRLGRPGSVEKALALLTEGAAPLQERVRFVQVLGETRPTNAVSTLTTLINKTTEPALQVALLAALQGYPDPAIGPVVVERLPSLHASAKPAARTLLLSRVTWMGAFVAGAATNTQVRAEATRDFVDALRRQPAGPTLDQVNTLWPPPAAPAAGGVDSQIARVTEVLRTGKGNPYAGKGIFRERCAGCHKLFNEGGEIGPDLTAFRRNDLPGMLLAILAPSVEIREGYIQINVEMLDGRLITGFVVDQDPRRVVMRGLDGQNVQFERAEVKEAKASKASLMPEGLVDDLNEQQLRDLFAYLRSSQPLSN